MDSFAIRLGAPVYHPPGQPATLVFVDYFGGQAVFLRTTEKGENIEDLQEEAKRMRKLRLMTRALEQPGLDNGQVHEKRI